MQVFTYLLVDRYNTNDVLSVADGVSRRVKFGQHQFDIRRSRANGIYYRDMFLPQQ